MEIKKFMTPRKSWFHPFLEDFDFAHLDMDKVCLIDIGC